MKTPITGRCACGAVTFQSARPPFLVRACFCRDCQFFASGNFTVNVFFASDGFQISGETTAYVSTADSGTEMRRQFCPKCGTPLFSNATSRPHIVGVRAGALDDPSIAVPASLIWTASAPPWAHIDPDLPTHERQPPPIRLP